MEPNDIVGRDLGTSDWFEITQKQVDLFADATGDHQWIHVDPHRALRGPFGSTIAHGYLTLSLVPFLSSQIPSPVEAKMTINYGLDRVRFITPVPVGSRVRSHVRILEARRVEGGLHLKSEVTVELEGSQKPACIAETLTRLYLRWAKFSKMKIYVGNLPWSYTSSDLRRLFEAFGAVSTANVVVERDTGRSRGFGFVEMDSEEEAKGAVEALNGSDCEDRKLTVEAAN